MNETTTVGIVTGAEHFPTKKESSKSVHKWRSNSVTYTKTKMQTPSEAPLFFNQLYSTDIISDLGC